MQIFISSATITTIHKNLFENNTFRLEAYHGQTVPILKHYEDKKICFQVNANQEIALVCEDCLKLL